jgi:hypothetical protein
MCEAMWTVADADQAAATGVAPTCLWCGTPICRDRAGAWIHLNAARGAYACRHPLFGWLPHYAQPRPRRRLAEIRRRSI